MKLKKNITKITALAGSAAMALSAVAVPVSAQLGDLPAPFVEDGQFEGRLVVGDTAAPQDILGAIDIAAGFQAESVTPVSVSGGGAVTVSGGTSEEVPLGTNLNDSTNAFGILDDTDVDFLQEGTVNIDIEGEDDDYDYSERMTFNGAKLATALTASSPDEDFGTDIFLELVRGSLAYNFQFEDSLEPGNYIANATDDDSIILPFAGQEMEIVDADSNSMTVEVGIREVLQVGDEVELSSGDTLSLQSASNENAVIEVNGQREFLKDGEDKRVNGVRIELSDAVDGGDGANADYAELLIGEETTETYDDGDEFIGEDEDDPNWVWELSNLDTANPTIGIEWDQTIDDPDDDGLVKLGDAVEYPNGFAELALDSLNQDEDDMQEFEVSIQTEELYESTGETIVDSSAEILYLEAVSGDDNGFSVGSEDTDTVALYYNSSADAVEVFWDDDNDLVKYTSNTFDLSSDGVDSDVDLNVDYRDSTFKLAVNVTNNTANEFELHFLESTSAGSPSSEDIKLAMEVSNNQFEYLGASDSDTETSGDLRYGSLDISGYEEDTRTGAGIIIDSYDSSASSDEFSFHVPQDITDFEVNTLVTGTGATVSRDDAVDTGAVEVNRAGVGLGVLASEARSLLGDTPMVVVGGPAVNDIASELLGNPTPEEVGQMFSRGMAKVRMFEDQQALLVAGFTAQDTVRASQVVADFRSYSEDLEGEEVELVFDGSDDVSFQEPTAMEEETSEEETSEEDMAEDDSAEDTTEQ